MTAPTWADIAPDLLRSGEFVFAVRWPIVDDSLTAWGAERAARVEWSAQLAEHGLWATGDPVFTVEVGDRPTLLGVAPVTLGPLELRSHRDPA